MVNRPVSCCWLSLSSPLARTIARSARREPPHLPGIEAYDSLVADELSSIQPRAGHRPDPVGPGWPQCGAAASSLATGPPVGTRGPREPSANRTRIREFRLQTAELRIRGRFVDGKGGPRPRLRRPDGEVVELDGGCPNVVRRHSQSGLARAQVVVSHPEDLLAVDPEGQLVALGLN